MNKIRVEDSTQAAAENIEMLLNVSVYFDQKDYVKATGALSRALKRQLVIAQGCDYNECISPEKDRVIKAMAKATQYLSEYQNP